MDELSKVTRIDLIQDLSFHVVIIGWSGKNESARKIAAEIEPACDRLTVIYSNQEERDECGAGLWTRLPNSAFFGPKFARALEDTPQESALLLIHADTGYEDWKFLLGKCRAAFSGIEALGVWAPDFTYIPCRTDLVSLLPQPGAPHLVSVTQTDGIVFALSPRVLARLRELDLRENNLGWGIDWAAIAFALTQGLLVLRDTSLRVQHARGRSYDLKNAADQMWRFLAQLSILERNQVVLLMQNFIHRRAEKRSLLRQIARRILRHTSANPIHDFEKIAYPFETRPNNSGFHSLNPAIPPSGEIGPKRKSE